MPDTRMLDMRQVGLKTFTVGCSRTVNLGNFESMRIEASVTMDTSEDYAVEDQREQAQIQLRSLLEETYRHQFQNPKGKQKDMP